MSIFDGYDRYGHLEDLSGITHRSKRQDLVVDIVNDLELRQPSERMKVGAQMVRLGIGSIAAPIPGNIDEAIGTALVLAGVATVLDESRNR